MSVNYAFARPIMNPYSSAHAKCVVRVLAKFIAPVSCDLHNRTLALSIYILV